MKALKTMALSRRQIGLTASGLILCAGCGAGLGGGHGHEGHDHASHTADTGGVHAKTHSVAAHAHGHLRLTPEQARIAELEWVQAGPGRITEAMTLPGSVSPNADAVLHVTPRVSGQVRAVYKQLGEWVEAGELLCILDSVELGDAVAAYLRSHSLSEAAERTLERERSLYAARLAALEKVLDGAIDVQQRIYDREKDLQQQAVSTVRPLLEADKALQLAKLDKERQEIELQAERDTRLLKLEVDWQTRQIDLAAASNKLRTLGLEVSQIAQLDEDSPLLSGEFRIVAPGKGVVVDRHVSNGEFVDAGAKLYIMENLAKVWFVASAFEEQLSELRSGQQAFVSLDAFPDTVLNGRVSFLDYHVDPTSRTVGVRITLDNQQLDAWPEDLPLRPGMFGRVELETAAREVAIVLPERALVHDDHGDYVFVEVGELEFERRDVVVRLGAGDLVEVVSGLEVGERVVARGTFLLKSAEREGELGGGHQH